MTTREKNTLDESVRKFLEGNVSNLPARITEVNMTRPLTEEEVRMNFLRHIKGMVKYWAVQPHQTIDEKLDGLAFSILVAIDGEAGGPPRIHIGTTSSQRGSGIPHQSGRKLLPRKRRQSQRHRRLPSRSLRKSEIDTST